MLSFSSGVFHSLNALQTSPPQLLSKLGPERDNLLEDKLEILKYLRFCYLEFYLHHHLLQRIMKVLFGSLGKRQTVASTSYCIFNTEKIVLATSEPTLLITVSLWAVGPGASWGLSRPRARAPRGACGHVNGQVSDGGSEQCGQAPDILPALLGDDAGRLLPRPQERQRPCSVGQRAGVDCPWPRSSRPSDGTQWLKATFATCEQIQTPGVERLYLQRLLAPSTS